MAYFSHAFRKTFVLNDVFATTGHSANLGTGDCGFYDAKTWNAIPVGEASIAQHPKVVFAQGRYRVLAGDKLGSHGGYTETFKSPVIDPRYVHRFWKVPGSPAQEHGVLAGWDGVNDDSAPKFYCGQNYHLRIDVKGSPVLRLVDHNVYHIFDVKTKCCSGDATELVDPIVVLLSFARQINESVIVSKFIYAQVTSSSGMVNPDTYVPRTDPFDIAGTFASLFLSGGYSDSRFSYFSFDPNDHYEMEPVIIASAQLVDQTGDPCSLIKPLVFTENQTPKAAQGSGNTVLREFILDNEYRQDPFPWDARKKDIVDFAYLNTGVANMSLFYESYFILFSTPRKYNPSGVHDNDLYLLRICAPQDQGLMGEFEDWFTAYLNSAGMGVVLEEMA